jgi:DNA-binding transcriptional MerR regulator
LAELAQLTELSETTIRYYVQQRLIRPIERRGTATRYERRELLRLLGFTRLKHDVPDLSRARLQRRLGSMRHQPSPLRHKPHPIQA